MALALLLASLVLLSARPAKGGAVSLLPALTVSLELSCSAVGGKEFVKLWHDGLKRQRMQMPDSAPDPAPRTVVAPHNSAMAALVPMDARNPLYSEGAQGAALRTRLLRDYMLAEEVSPEDDKLKQAGGYQATNYNNQTITFTRNEQGELKVGDFPVMAVEKTPDGAFVYVFMGILFGHNEAVKAAMHRLYQGQPQHTAFGG